MRIVITCCSFLLMMGLYAQQDPMIKGKVSEQNLQPLVGANIYWMGTNDGGSSDENGFFQIEQSSVSNKLIVSFTGFVNDTIFIENQTFLELILQSSLELDELEVTARVKSTSINFRDPIKVETIGEEELCKAACCNLSESFETNPSVDASFTDAVTGTRQIQMLGLAGPYTQITRENIPDIRGLSAIYGLSYTPGPWVESISLIKGTGTVVNGYESIAGQIDVALRKPQTMDRFYMNLFANQEGRLEANFNLKTAVNDKWSTALLLHGKNNSNRHDKNKDGFMDMPLGKSLIALNRWNYNYDGVVLDFGVKATFIDQLGGQNNFYESDLGSHKIWGMQTQTKRLEAWSKTGFVFDEQPNKSMGLQLSGVYHDFTSDFGLRNYDAKQQSFYANYIFQNIIGNKEHMYKLGASFVYDDYQQDLALTPFNHTEMIPGAFAEYTYNWEERLNVVAGLRGDYHNQFGFFMTPRLHLRYLLTDNLVIRASAGRGQRTAQIISENIGILASNRAIIVNAVDSDKPYGLDAEVAWNYGVNLTYEFELDYRSAVLSFDVYRTQFENQIIVDLDSDVREVQFYNLKGSSYSNSFQAQVDYELINRFDVRLAYRWYDVKATYGDELMAKPFVSAHRAFANLAYETRNKWKFDATVNWQGQKRLPSTMDNPIAYQRSDKSPSFFLLNAQVTKVWNDKLDIYLGVENILDYKQADPIVAADQPFSENFDASMVWAPVFGRNIYIGLRYRIK